MRPLAPVLAFALALVGCVAPGSTVKPQGADDAAAALAPLAFESRIIDKVRAGGEPVIQVTQKGTLLVSAHPGWTHTRYPPSANLLTPASAQSYLWRSTDNGSTWSHVGLPMAPGGAGPRGLGQGVSDPDFAMDSKGRVYLTDLEALVSASVSWSDDDGASWILGNDVAASFGGAPIDRNWLATRGTDVYFMGNYFSSENLLKSTDGGITWTKVGATHCGSDFTTRESDGAILVGCGAGVDVSTDGGAHFEVRRVPGEERGGGITMAEPAVDAAGNVFVTWTSKAGVLVAGTSDLGVTWTTPLQLQPTANGSAGTNLFPWVVAGDAGRVAVAWFHSDAENATRKADSKWFVEMAIVLDAMGSAPVVTHARVTSEPIHTGYVCVGTVCQADPGATGDRRLGDFFEATIDREGRVLMAYAVTTGGDSISHPGFARQTSGPLLRTVASVGEKG